MESERVEIRKLDDDVIRLIAAGEVIERPISVVKELIENSLDAGSKQIEVKLERGGLASIVVRDDGFGIPSDQVPLLLERHTTSKILLESDLEDISTLGFRGEALYSIASAGDLVISTRHRSEDAGTQLTVKSGKKSINPIPWPGGTQVECLDLFHSTPARRKFLKSEAAEFSRVAQLISAYALAYPEIAWKLSHNGRETLRAPGSEKLVDALTAVHGVETARNMLAVNYFPGDLAITGAISTLEIHRARRTDQVIFLNGRLIKDPGITSALERPFMQFLPHGRRPIAILNIECDPSTVDVNVHPHKTEVRLANARAITGSVYNAVKKTLESNHPVTGSDISPAIDETTGEVTLPSNSQKSYESPAFSPTSRPLKDEHDWAIRKGKRKHTSEIPVEFDPAHQIQKSSVTDRSLPHQYPAFGQMDLPDNLPAEGNSIQFANTYIIYNSGSAVYLIDQHNLHERILFDQFSNLENQSKPVSQALLFPLQINLSTSIASAIRENIDFINSLGFEIEEFSGTGSGGSSYVIRSVPQALSKSDPVQAFTDIMERVTSEEGSSGGEGFRKAFIINMSCKSAIKAGATLSTEEIKWLIDQIGDGTYMTCPHGRPVIIKLDEHWFKRSFHRS